MEDYPPTVHDVEEDSLNLSSTSTIAFQPKEDTAPIDFQVLSSDSEDEKFHQLSGNSDVVFSDRIPCPLCKRRRQRLTCAECLGQGNFYVQNRNYRDSTQSKERYSDLVAKFQIVQRNLEHLRSQCAIYTERKAKIASIAEEIDKFDRTIDLQKQLKSALKTKIIQAQEQSNYLKTEMAKKLARWPDYRIRLNRMRSKYVEDCNKLRQFHDSVQKRQDSLTRGTKSKIIELRAHIFSIEDANAGTKAMFGSTNIESWSDEEDDTVRSLMAARSNYWARPDASVSSSATYIIVGEYGPTLPASGDYSAYTSWAERNQSGVTSGGASHRNPAYSIISGLTYVTQFVNLIAYYLDLRLPHRLSYSEFTNGDVLNGKFNRKVAKLNANVVHLCSSQGIHATSLQPRKTVSNLLLLFDPEQSDLGRRGPFVVASELAKSMEDSIEKDLVIYEGQGSTEPEEWDSTGIPSDWETINRYDEMNLATMKTELGHPTAAPLSPSIDSIYRSSSSNSLSSTGSGLISSFTSYFRTWKQ